MFNCNAAIFVRSKDVVVVDTHSKPSAAAVSACQMKREVTTKPVRYVINTHFHWDHTQGSHAYRVANEKVDFIASAATKAADAEAISRQDEGFRGRVPQQIDALRNQAARATSAGEKAFCAEQIRQLQAYQAELQNYTLELPTITFDKSYLLQDPALRSTHRFSRARSHRGRRRRLLPARACDRNRRRDSRLFALHRRRLSSHLAGHH